MGHVRRVCAQVNHAKSALQALKLERDEALAEAQRLRQELERLRTLPE
jgi:hypothetical protein